MRAIISIIGAIICAVCGAVGIYLLAFHYTEFEGLKNFLLMWFTIICMGSTYLHIVIVSREMRGQSI